MRPKMLPNKKSAELSLEALQAVVALLTKKHRRWRRSRKRHSLYRYLETLFIVFGRWKRVDVSWTAGVRMGNFARLKDPYRHPLRILIDSSSDADRRSKSRWT